MELSDVTISGAGEDAGRGSILLACAYPPVKLLNMRFQRIHAGFKAVRLHDREATVPDGGSGRASCCDGAAPGGSVVGPDLGKHGGAGKQG